MCGPNDEYTKTFSMFVTWTINKTTKAPSQPGKHSSQRHNDSTSPAMDRSGLDPSSLVQVQSKEFSDRDRSNPQFFGTWTELDWTVLDQSTRAESARIHWELLIH